MGFIWIFNPTAFSQWMFLDQIYYGPDYPAWTYSCIDFTMVKPDVGYWTCNSYYPTMLESEKIAEVIKFGDHGGSNVFSSSCFSLDGGCLHLENIRFINDKVGYFSYQNCGGCGTSCSLYITENGGSTWSMVQGIGKYYGPFLTSAQNFYYYRWSSNGKTAEVYLYHKGVDTKRKTITGSPIINAIYFLNDSTGFLSYNQSLFRTADWGKTWIPLDTITGKVSVFSFPTSQVGYIVKSGTSLFKTTDGGLSWVMLGIQPVINSMDFINDSTGYAVGNNGLILYTNNGGQLWVVQPSPRNGKFIRIQFVTPTVGYIYEKTSGGSFRIRTICDGSPDFVMATYDTFTKKNQIVWNKGINYSGRFTPLTCFNIYREDSSGVMMKIGTLPFNQSGIFIDSSSVPDQKAYRYTLTSVDSSGYESPKSKPRSSIFLEATCTNVTEYELKWTPADGSSVVQYMIYRQQSGATWQLIDSVGSICNQYPLTGDLLASANFMIKAVVSDSGIVTTVEHDPVSNIVEFSQVKVHPSNQLVARQSGTVTFTVEACNIWIATSDVPWCSVTHSGFGNDTIVANYEENTTQSDRVAQIEIKLVDVPTVKQTITVTQAKSMIGLEQHENIPIRCYPNPATSEIIVELTEKLDNSRITIYSVTGQEIITRSAIQDRNKINIADLLPGVYFIRLQDKSISYFTKFVKK